MEREPEANAIQVVDGVREAVVGFVSTSPFATRTENISSGYEQVFSPGSRVFYRESGALAEEVTIIEPAIVEGQLMYRIEVTQSRAQPMRLFIRASSVEPPADASVWEYQQWNRETETYIDPPDENDAD